MIPVLLLAAAAALPATIQTDAQRFANCAARAKSDPTRAIAEAEAWLVQSKEVPARQCLGLAYVGAERWLPAAIAFEQAATAALAAGDGRAATLWTQAANAALAGEDPRRARGYIDRALSLPTLAPQMRGEAWFDRARADVALGELNAGRTDLDNGLRYVPQDPFGWLLSATLARRQNDLPRAAKDIAEAARLAPDDAAVALEAGNVAAVSGKPEAAQIAWTRAVELGRDTAEGKAAAAALASGK